GLSTDAARGCHPVHVTNAASALCWLAPVLFACSPPERMERVVRVTIDTLRADHVGCYGAKEVETATLDGIAARGVRFETAISPAPITLPGHTTLLTGLDAPGHSVGNKR